MPEEYGGRRESCHNISDKAFTEEVACKLGFADPLSLKLSFRSMKLSSFLKMAQKETETEHPQSMVNSVIWLKHLGELKC